jgi:small redox-active disulfide protein 2
MPNEETFSLGYTFHYAHHRKGYAFEALSALTELGISAEVTKVGDLLEIVKLGVLSAPSLMVDGKLVVSGKVASQKEIVKILKKYC